MPNNPYAPEALKKRLSGSSDNVMDLPNINTSGEDIKVKSLEESTMDGNADDKDYVR